MSEEATVDEADVRHLTRFQTDDAPEELAERVPDDRVEFELFYDGQYVTPWAEGPTEMVRLYFTDDEYDDAYVPVNFAEQLEADLRSTPIGRPTVDDDDDEDALADLQDRYRIQEDATVDGHSFDLLWFAAEDDDETVIVATDFGERDA